MLADIPSNQHTKRQSEEKEHKLITLLFRLQYESLMGAVLCTYLEYRTMGAHIRTTWFSLNRSSGFTCSSTPRDSIIVGVHYLERVPTWSAH